MLPNATLHDPVAFALSLAQQAVQRWDAARDQGQKTLPFARVALRGASLLVRAAAQQPQWRDPAQNLVQQIADRAQAEDAALAAQGVIEHVWLGMLLTCCTLRQRLDHMAERAQSQPQTTPKVSPVTPPLPSALPARAAYVAPRPAPPRAHLAPEPPAARPLTQRAKWLAEQRAKGKRAR